MALVVAWGVAAGGVGPLHPTANRTIKVVKNRFIVIPLEDKARYYTAAYETWDVDADGYVSYQEFQQKFVDSKLFAKWDENDSSLLEQGEFQQALQEIGMTGSPTPLDFEQADENQSGRLDIDEFTKTVYNTWDMDGDGGVTVAEYEKSLDQFGVYANLDSDQDGSIDESDAKASLWNTPQ